MSGSSPKVIAIKCTSCAAPLEIVGGGRVSTITCSYCNTLLDLNDHYKILTKFHSKYRPPTPLTLGMQGTIKGTQWTIIGWIAYKTADFPTERWSEFLLYSPLYGYAWLIYEEGEILFSKRIRDFSLREWQDKRDPKTVFYKGGHFVANEGSYLAEVDFVQGELTWIAMAGDSVRCWDYRGVKRKSISIEKTKDEYEVHLNEKLDAHKVYESFGVATANRVKAKQSMKEKIFDEGSLDASERSFSTFARWISMMMAILLIAILFSLVSSNTLVENRTNRPMSDTFTISSEAFVAEIELKAPNHTMLDACRLTLYKSDKKILSIDKDGIYPHNKDFGYSWAAGRDNEILMYLKLKEGYYRVSLEHISPMSDNRAISLTVKERVMRLIYIVPLFILMLLMMMPTIKQYYVPSQHKDKFWWIAVAVLGFYFVGIGIPVAVGAIYLLTGSMRESMDEVTKSSKKGSR